MGTRDPHPPVHRQGRRRQDQHRCRHGAAVRRSAVTARSCSRPTSPTASPTRSTPRSGPSRARSRRTCGARSRTSSSTSRATGARSSRYLPSSSRWRGLDEVMAEEMTVLPGMDELGNLLWIGDHVDSGDYDLIVVDAAPTGETLRLLSLPEASRWWIERIAPIGRRVSKLGGPVLERMIGVPVPREEVFAAAERLLGRLDTRPSAAGRSRALVGPDRPEPGEAVDRRGPALVHLLPPVRLPERPDRRQPRAAAGRRRRYFEACRETQQSLPARWSTSISRPVPVRTVPFFDQEMVGAASAARDRAGPVRRRGPHPSSSTAAGRTRSASRRA